ncbi:hypothetical protein [Nitrosomonas oligotropha]|uniref:hypothetical protein n=1 Tax=Nitrosomonas oligotropha TaxID=42354 RepID=UPI0013692FFE|nr:hypothetical protein [Nitrosomonas oligotropha]MXS83651.1 hypothetical protein [Nitrosomonas oligotropha]
MYTQNFSTKSNNCNDNLIEITSRLKGGIRRHNGGILAFCPSHDDRKGRSLAVSLGRQDQVLMHCFAGCSIHEITQAIGLNPADLFPPSDNPRYEKTARSGFSAWQLLRAIHADLTRLLIISSDLKKIDALSADDSQFISEVVLRLNDSLSYLEGTR